MMVTNNLTKALIGHTGFVGSALKKQTSFPDTYRSTDIETIRGRHFETVVCAGASAKKWLANSEPEMDVNNIEILMENISRIRCHTFILISTADVFSTPVGVSEKTDVDERNLSAYGLNRRRLEKFVEETFSNHLIVRLPGLVGKGLRKNIIYDFLNDNRLSAIDSRAIFQFYPIRKLWKDINIAMENQLKLIHLTAEPVSVAEVALKGFRKMFNNHLALEPPIYDFRSIHAPLYCARGSYQYSKRDSLQTIQQYAQTEPVNGEADK